MARRGENIFKRKDGRWEARVAEYGIDGERRYRSLYGRTYAEAKAKKEEYFASRQNKKTQTACGSVDFSQVAEHWLASVKSTVRESTYTRYYRNVCKYLLPQFGKRAVSKIDPPSVDRFKDALLSFGGKCGTGLSEKTVTDILSVLKLILGYAAETGFDVMSTGLIRNPKRRCGEISTFSEEKAERLEEILLSSHDTLSLGVLLALHTGIRNGELCGLRWGDINFDSMILHIERTVERISDLDPLTAAKTKVIVSEPKTESSRRDIPLPQVLCEYLSLHRGKSDTYILTGTDKPCEPHTLYVRYERLLRRNGFEGYTFHALRHTFATRGAESGIDVKALSELLGHSDIGTTLRCYIHPSTEQKRRQMEIMFDGEIRSRKYGL